MSTDTPRDSSPDPPSPDDRAPTNRTPIARTPLRDGAEPADRRIRVVALVNDLIFESRIAAVAETIGTSVRVVRSAEALHAALVHADRLMIDLHAEAVDPLKLIGDARRARPTLEIIGFFSHVHTETRKAALSAGADRVLPRSVFVQKLAELLA